MKGFKSKLIAAAMAMMIATPMVADAGYFYVKDPAPITMSSMFTDLASCQAAATADSNAIQDCVAVCSSGAGLWNYEDLIDPNGPQHTPKNMDIVGKYAFQADCIAGEVDAEAAGFAPVAGSCAYKYKCTNR